MSDKEAAILCVDDESIILNSLRTELREAFGNRFLIEVAESGEEALEILQELLEEGVEVPVVISDYIMPEMRGDDFLIQTHRMNPRIKTIMLTGQSGLEGVTNVINKGHLYRYLSKPWASDDLKMTVEQAFLSFYQEEQLKETNEQLKVLNASLEEKVQQRTEQLKASNQYLEKLSQELVQKTALIEEKNRNIEASLNYAKRLQTATMPSQEAIRQLLPNSFLFYKPRDVVSGDFYWVERVGDEIIIVASDCTGHGIPGAFLSTIGTVLLDKVVLDGKLTDPARILEELDACIKQTFRHNAKSIADGMDTSICAFNPTSLKLTFAGAKNPMLLVKNGQLELFKGSRNGIGNTIKLDEPYVNEDVQLAKGDEFFLYSDGFQDQFGGAQGKKFMAKNFRELLLKLHHLEADQKEPLLAEALQTWVGNRFRQLDDILVIGVKI